MWSEGERDYHCCGGRGDSGGTSLETLGKLRSLKEKIAGLKSRVGRLEDLLRRMRPSCEYLYHRPNEKHADNQACPVESKFRDIIDPDILDPKA